MVHRPTGQYEGKAGTYRNTGTVPEISARLQIQYRTICWYNAALPRRGWHARVSLLHTVILSLRLYYISNRTAEASRVTSSFLASQAVLLFRQLNHAPG